MCFCCADSRHEPRVADLGHIKSGKHIKNAEWWFNEWGNDRSHLQWMMSMSETGRRLKAQSALPAPAVSRPAVDQPLSPPPGGPSANAPQPPPAPPAGPPPATGQAAAAAAGGARKDFHSEITNAADWRCGQAPQTREPPTREAPAPAPPARVGLSAEPPTREPPTREPPTGNTHAGQASSGPVLVLKATPVQATPLQPTGTAPADGPVQASDPAHLQTPGQASASSGSGPSVVATWNVCNCEERVQTMTVQMRVLQERITYLEEYVMQLGLRFQ